MQLELTKIPFNLRLIYRRRIPESDGLASCLKLIAVLPTSIRTSSLQQPGSSPLSTLPLRSCIQRASSMQRLNILQHPCSLLCTCLPICCDTLAGMAMSLMTMVPLPVCLLCASQTHETKMLCLWPSWAMVQVSLSEWGQVLQVVGAAPPCMHRFGLCRLICDWDADALACCMCT